MTRPPYIYTLPEGFIKDQAVPARWRIWAVVNGFFVSGKKCWASNEWLADQIGVHKDTVSQAVKELELMGVLQCERTARTRLISPGNPMIGDNAYQEGGSTPISDRHQRLSTSVSNSDNLHTSNSEELRVEKVTTEDEERQPRVKTDTTYRGVFELWGKYPLNWRTNKTEIQAAKNLLEEHGLEDCKEALAFFNKHKKEEMCPQILKPSDLDRKRANLMAYNNKV